MLRALILSRRFLGMAFFIVCVLSTSVACVSTTEKGAVTQVGPERKAERVDAALVGLDFTSGHMMVERSNVAWRSAFEQGDEAWRRGDTITALSGFVRAMAASPNEPTTYLPLARLLRRLQRPEAAEAALRTALDLDPETPRVA